MMLVPITLVIWISLEKMIPSPSVRSMPSLRSKHSRPKSPTSASDTMDSEEGKRVLQQIQKKLVTAAEKKSWETSQYPGFTFPNELEEGEATGIDQTTLKHQEEKEKEIEKNRVELRARTEVAKSGNDEWVREDDQISGIILRNLDDDETGGKEGGHAENTKQVQVEVSRTEVFTNPGGLLNIGNLKDIISEEVYFNTVHNQALTQRSPSLWTPTNPHDEKPAILVQIPEWMPLYHTTWYALNADNLSIYAIYGTSWTRIKEKGSFNPRNSDTSSYPMDLVRGPNQGSPKSHRDLQPRQCLKVRKTQKVLFIHLIVRTRYLLLNLPAGLNQLEGDVQKNRTKRYPQS